MVPRDGAMKPPTDLSRVDLPHPEGPRITNFSPSAIENDTPSTAVNSPFSVGYEIVTSRTLRRLDKPRTTPVSASWEAHGHQLVSEDHLTVIDFLDVANTLFHRAVGRQIRSHVD